MNVLHLVIGDYATQSKAANKILKFNTKCCEFKLKPSPNAKYEEEAIKYTI